MTVGKYYELEALDARETLANRSTPVDRRIKPIVTATRLFEFNETQVKQVLAKYVAETYGVDVDANKITGDYREASYSSQFDQSPAYCKFTVKVDG